MCALPKRFDAFVIYDGTRAGKNPRRRELFDASMCGDIRRFRVGTRAPTGPKLATRIDARRCAMAADSKTAIAHVQLMDGYRFTATFPDVAGADSITLDEAAPLGTGTGPTPAGLLAAAVGGCLSASMTLCLNKAHLEPDAVNAHVTARMGRN